MQRQDLVANDSGESLSGYAKPCPRLCEDRSNLADTTAMIVCIFTKCQKEKIVFLEKPKKTNETLKRVKPAERKHVHSVQSGSVQSTILLNSPPETLNAVPCRMPFGNSTLSETSSQCSKSAEATAPYL